jgi:hypothetical protein
MPGPEQSGQPWIPPALRKKYLDSSSCQGLPRCVLVLLRSSSSDINAFTEGLNVGPDFCTVIGAVGLQSFGAMAKGEKVFNLDDLNE